MMTVVGKSRSYISTYLMEEVFQTHSSIIARIHSVFTSGFNVQYQDQLIFIGHQVNDLSAIGMVIETGLLKTILSEIKAGDVVRIHIQRQTEQSIDLGWTLYLRPQSKSFSLTEMTLVNTQLPKMDLKTLFDGPLLAGLLQANLWEDSGFAKSPTLEST